MTQAANPPESLYAPLMAARHDDLPFIVAQLGQSLDGCVATATGDSYFVTGPESLVHLHRLRSLCDVVVVGAGTVAADNPRLTTRRVPGPNPVRAVLDPQARLDGQARVFTDSAAPTLWICDTAFAPLAMSRLADLGAARGSVDVIGIDGWLGPDGYDPVLLVQALAIRGLKRVFIEGGGVTVSRFLSRGCLDRLHLIVAPVFIGAGKPGLALPSWATMADCPRPPAAVHRMGDDVLWDLDLRQANPPVSA